MGLFLIQIFCFNRPQASLFIPTQKSKAYADRVFVSIALRRVSSFRQIVGPVLKLDGMFQSPSGESLHSDFVRLLDKSAVLCFNRPQASLFIPTNTGRYRSTAYQ